MAEISEDGTVYDKAGVCNYKKVGFGGPVEGGGMGLGEGVKRGCQGGMGHRLINDACCVSHQDFF